MQGREVPIKDVRSSTLSSERFRLLTSLRYTRAKRIPNRGPGRSPLGNRAHSPRRSWAPSSRRRSPRNKPSRTSCRCAGADFQPRRPPRSPSRPRLPNGSAAIRSPPWILLSQAEPQTSFPRGSPHSTSSTFSIIRALASTSTPLLPLAKAPRQTATPATVSRSSSQMRSSRCHQLVPRRFRTAKPRHLEPRRPRPRPRKRPPRRATQGRSQLPPRRGRLR